jgi:hypothetical protein
MLELFLAISNVGGQISVSHLRGASDPQQRTRSITGETERLCILKATVQPASGLGRNEFNSLDFAQVYLGWVITD